MKSLAATGIVAASMLAIPAPSSADVRVGIGVHIGNGPRYGRYDDGTFRIGYNRGYDDGYKEGGKDGRRGERFSFWDEGRYRNGDRGYRRNYGPRWQYSDGYRNGFEAGYRRGYAAFSRRYDRRYDRGYDRGYDRYDYRHKHAGSDDWCYDRHDRR